MSRKPLLSTNSSTPIPIRNNKSISFADKNNNNKNNNKPGFVSSVQISHYSYSYSGSQMIKSQTADDLSIYDPFQTPPNFLKAQRHYQATKIGYPILCNENGSKNDQQLALDICPCCQNPVNKTPIPLCCSDQDLLFLGVGYSLYYKLARYIAWLIILVFFISGSAFYFLITMNCKENCLTFFGFKIINFEAQDDQSSKSVQMFNMITAIGIFGFVLYLKSHLNKEINILQSKVICPSQYTIMIQHLPKNFQEAQLKKWIKDTFDEQPVIINLGFDISELQSAYAKRNKYTVKMNKILIKSRESSVRQHSYGRKIVDDQSEDEQSELKEKIEKYDKIIFDYRNNNTECDKNGTAFVTFESAQVVEEILQKYEKSVFRTLFSSAMSNFTRNNHLIFKDSFAFQVFFIISMVSLIVIAFRYQFKFANYAYSLRTEGTQSGQALIIFQAIIMSLIVISLNSLLRIIIFIFTKLKRYHSYSAQQSAFCFYYSMMYIFNSCFMIYIVHGQYPEQTNELLLYDIHFIMLANGFSQPLFKLFDPIMWYKIIWKKYVQSLKKSTNPYTQMSVNKWWQGHEISNGDNYAYIGRVLIVTVWFAHPAPLGVVFCLVGLACDYWIGKAMLLRVYKKPENISKSIAMPIMNSFELLPLVYICGVLEFTYKVSTNSNIIDFLWNFLQYGITTSVLLICIVGYLLFFRTETKVIPETPYSQIKGFFGFNYETQNPITKYTGQINYLYGMLKNQHRGNGNRYPRSQKDHQLISSLINLGRTSTAGLDMKRAELGKLKMKMIKEMKDSGDQQNDIQLNEVGENVGGKDFLNNKKDNKNDGQSDSSSERGGAVAQSKISSRKRKYKLKKTSSIFS